MFEFFRGDTINPSYWHEKLEAVDKMDGSKEFSVDKFADILRTAAESQIECMEIDEEVAEEIRFELNDAIDEVEFESEARKVGSEFDMNGVSFPDFWEYDLQDFTLRYLWACHAIRWGIAQYDGLGNHAKP